MLGCADDGDSFLRKDRFCEVPFMAAELRAAEDEVRATCYRARAVESATPDASYRGGCRCYRPHPTGGSKISCR